MDQAEFTLAYKRLDVWNSAIQAIIKWRAVVSIVWIGASAVKSLAGRQTLANIVVSFVVSLKLGEKISYLAGAGGVLYGYRQRRLRRINTERLAGRIQQLEKERDPGRTSSGITTRGTTRPDDRSLG